MAEEVKLPQLGESVTEGVITAWLVEEGETVEEDQPLFEISTDKIDTEVPSPAGGVLQEIRAQVDDTVEVGEVVAVIGDGDGDGDPDEGADEADDDTDQADDDTDQADGDTDQAEDEAETEEAADREEREEAAAEEVDEDAETGDEAPSGDDAPSDDEGADEGSGDRRDDTNGESRLMSPIVRRLVREHDLDPSRIEGSGQGGRITREDVEKAIESGDAARQEPAGDAARAPARSAPTGRAPHQNVRGRTEKLERVRAAIAKHMWDSLHTTAQLTAAREVDVTTIMDVRGRAKDAFREREGVGLSPLPFLARAVCMVLPQHEALNASIDVDAGQVKYYETINLGIAVDAPQGLMVPNIKDAQDLTVPALAKAIADIADRVRSRKITPDDVQGGTFTITNTGSRGVLFDTPVLNPPETGILATPSIEKRPVVVERDGSDAIAIRYMTYLCLTYDHRMVDGADAARFLGDLQEVIETHDWATEIGV